MLPDTPPPSPPNDHQATATAAPGSLAKKTSMRNMLETQGISVERQPTPNEDPLCGNDTEDRDDDFLIAFNSLEDLKQNIKNESVNIQDKCSVSITTKDGKTIIIYGTPREIIRQIREIVAEDAANTEDPQQAEDRFRLLTELQEVANAIDEAEERNRRIQSFADSIVNSRRQSFAEPQPARNGLQIPEAINTDNISEFNDEEAEQPPSLWQRIRSCFCCGSKPQWRHIK